MCTIAFLLGVADAPLVIAANRDELYARPTRAPERLAPGLLAPRHDPSEHAPRVVGGVDVISGGTWLAVHRAGRFAAVTNQRALAPPPPGLRSRGLAVRELAIADDPDAYVDALDPRAYASMNLAWGDAERVRIAYCRVTGDKHIVDLAPGIHVLCNDRLGSPGFPRGVRLHDAIAPHVRAAFPELAQVIERALGDHTREPIADSVDSHLPRELARELTATCIHSEHYGTRSSTIVALDRGGVRAYLHADGPPCTTPFADLGGLLA